MTIGAVVVAAGRGTRMGAARPKALVRLGERSLLRRSVALFAAHPRISRVVAVVIDIEEARADLGADAAGVAGGGGGAARPGPGGPRPPPPRRGAARPPPPPGRGPPAP